MSIEKEYSQTFDCEACRNEAGVMREYMITCPDCGNKRCPQALDHRYLCTGSNEKVQKFTLKTTPIYGESTSDDLGQSPHKWLFEQNNLSEVLGIETKHNWIGAKVVYVSPKSTNGIWQIQKERPSISNSDFEIKAANGGFPAPSHYWEFYVKAADIRLATEDEIAAGHRIEEPLVDTELKAPEPKLHWFLVGYSYIVNGRLGMGSIQHSQKHKNITSKDLALVSDRLVSMNPNFSNLVISSISAIGCMTKTEFYDGCVGKNIPKSNTHKCDHENTDWEKISPEPDLQYICLSCGENTSGENES